VGVFDHHADRIGRGVGFEIAFGLDVAGAELYDADEDVYRYGDETRTPDEQIDYIADLVDEYGLVYVEDPLEENDFEGFADLTERVGGRTLVCGDDLFVTDVDRIERGIEAGGRWPVLVSLLGAARARSGDVEPARQALSELQRRKDAEAVAPIHEALVHTWLGDEDAALDALEDGLDQRHWLMSRLAVEPMWDPLRERPRFQAVLDSVGLSAVPSQLVPPP
jgi:hypothetical protein